MTYPGLNGAHSVVRRLRVASAGADVVAARLRASSLLGGVSLVPAWLSPTAVVCVRRVRRPAPPARGRDPFGPPREWQRAVLADIESQIRGAARPALGHAPADAGCVLFADRAELLACAAADWLGGRAAEQWWWKSLLGRGAAGAPALLELWRRESEYVPGALEHLAGKGRVAAFARQLPPGEARAILFGVASTFALGALRTALACDERAPSHFASASTRDDERADELARAGDGASPPWRVLVPECAAAGLGFEAESLLGVGLSLSRAPSLVGREDFARRAAAWADSAARNGARRAASDDQRRATGNEPGRSPAPRAREQARDSRGGRQPGDATRHAPEVGGRQDVLPRAPAPAARRAPAGGADEARVAGRPRHEGGAGAAGEKREGSGRGAQTSVGEVGGASPAPEVDLGATAGESRAGETSAGRESSESSAARERRELVSASLLEAEIETRFGGLFHLVNFALYLDLYGDFTMPAELGLPLPVWDFIALVGRRLAGARVERDAVWPLLAKLAGRDEERGPGADFDPPDEWRTPADWLKPFGDSAALRWSAAAGRLRVAHPAGFLLLDVALDDANDASPDDANGASHEDSRGVPRGGAADVPRDGAGGGRQLARELRPYVEAGASVRLRRVGRVRAARGRTPLARWLDRLSAYAVARLGLALGVRGARGVSRLLCERHARVFVTAAHVDVVMRLCELPVEVRYAGLDRDPGWIPAAARRVAFHFE